MSQELADIQRDWIQQQYDAVLYGGEMYAPQPQYHGRLSATHTKRHTLLPSSNPSHPYTRLHLSNLPSGNTLPAPPPHACPECNMDLFIESAQLRHSQTHNVPEFSHRRVMERENSRTAVTFDTDTFVSVTYGVPIHEILSFRAKLREADARVLPFEIGMGPITMVLEVG
ncbi:hypothetical protein R3P38DRAFT_2810478 [Favolaschia claudopus]|uniref:C2H2-type domain-containing protein n=1 Tax=Favolaschia claudopus TaxID=2862362 RepID=A0AAV9ZAE8_9AGAR